MKVDLSERTRESLRNLFKILNIEGENFDERLFKLASLAFMGRAEVEQDKKTLIEHARYGDGRQPRTKIEVKKVTADRLKALFYRTYPFLEWQSWNWWLADMLDFYEEKLAEIEAEEGLNRGKEKE